MQSEAHARLQTLVEADLTDLSYKQIVLDHPEEFSARAIWYANRTLGLGNATEKPPVEEHSITQDRTSALVKWLQVQASQTEGFLPPFTNADAARVMGMHERQRYGQVHRNIQPRIDFACYVCDLPPLGCAAEAPFGRAWALILQVEQSPDRPILERSGALVDGVFRNAPKNTLLDP